MASNVCGLVYSSWASMEWVVYFSLTSSCYEDISPPLVKRPSLATGPMVVVAV